MKALIIGVLFSATCIWSQTDDVLTALTRLQKPLAALQDPKIDRAVAAGKLTDAMMPLAEPDRQPAREVVSGFTKELVTALAGKKLDGEQMANLSACLWIVMKGVVPNLKSTGLLRQALTLAGVSDNAIQVISTHFLAIAEEVRGPDDLPVARIE